MLKEVTPNCQSKRDLNVEADGLMGFSVYEMGKRTFGCEGQRFLKIYVLP